MMTTKYFAPLLTMLAFFLLGSGVSAFGGADPALCPESPPEGDCTSIGNFLQCFYDEVECTAGRYQCNCSGNSATPDWSCSCRGSGVKEADSTEVENLDVGSEVTELEAGSGAGSLATSIAMASAVVVAAAFL